MYYSKDDYKLVGFEPSSRKNKKYNALIKNKYTNKIIKLAFGEKRYQQYEDTTGLNIYNDLNHYDEKRRELYRRRHKKDLIDNYFSAGYFANFYLW
jgi:hypothetical protein